MKQTILHKTHDTRKFHWSFELPSGIKHPRFGRIGKNWAQKDHRHKETVQRAETAVLKCRFLRKMSSSLNYHHAQHSLGELNMMAGVCHYENYTGKIFLPLLVNHSRSSTKDRHFPNFLAAQVASFQPSVGLTITKIMILHDTSVLATLLLT